MANYVAPHQDFVLAPVSIPITREFQLQGLAMRFQDEHGRVTHIVYDTATIVQVVTDRLRGLDMEAGNFRWELRAALHAQANLRNLFDQRNHDVYGLPMHVYALQQQDRQRLETIWWLSNTVTRQNEDITRLDDVEDQLSMEETMNAHLARDLAARDATIANLQETMVEMYRGWGQTMDVLTQREDQVGHLQRRNARFVHRQGRMVYEIAQLRATSRRLARRVQRQGRMVRGITRLRVANRRLTESIEQRDDALEDLRGWLAQASSDDDHHQRVLVQRDNTIAAQGRQIHQLEQQLHELRAMLRPEP